MGKTMTRRELSVLAVSGVGALALPLMLGAKAFAGDVNGDRPSQDEKLAKVLKELESARGRLADVAEGWVAPDGGDAPALRALLSSIRTECSSLNALAQGLEERLTR
jgi:hypothetical protein